MSIQHTIDAIKKIPDTSNNGEPIGAIFAWKAYHGHSEGVHLQAIDLKAFVTYSEDLEEEFATQKRELERLQTENKKVERLEAACREAGHEIMGASMMSTHSQQWKHISKAHSILILAVGDKDISRHEELTAMIDAQEKI